MGNDERTFEPTDHDDVKDSDTEGHDARRQFPAPPVHDERGGTDGLIGDSGEGRAQLDTEGHRAAPALPPRGGEDALPRRPGPGEHLDGDADTEGHIQFRRRPGEAGE